MTDLYNQLRELRRKLADAEGVEVFRVFNNATIEDICAKLPKSLEELLEVKGMREKKVQKYGKSILAIVNSITSFVVPAQAGIHDQEMLDSGLPAEDLVETGITPPANTKQQITVSQYLDYLNVVFQRTADVKVVGEVSGSKMYPSGFYFTLKDKADESVLSCYLPVYTYRGLSIPIEDGMEISVEGMPRLVKRNGRFQFTVENVELVGEGTLKKAYDVLRAKLGEEGLFARKRELPEFITSVGVITSRVGAVIHDFRNNLARLGIKVYLKDVRVEGANSPGMVIQAIKYFNQYKFTSPSLSLDKERNRTATQSAPVLPLSKGELEGVDVLVIMRGGGSMEDLQGFNNEQVVRAVFGSRIPTIVSIGHDQDVPLAQLAADVMVSTPTAAAHAVSATWRRLVEGLPYLESSLLYSYSEVLAQQRSKFAISVSVLSNWCSRLGQSYKRLQELLLSFVDKHVEWMQQQKMGLKIHAGRIAQMQGTAKERLKIMVKNVISFLDQVNPERQLGLGYAIVKSSNGKVIRSVKQVSSGDILTTQVSDGNITSLVR